MTPRPRLLVLVAAAGLPLVVGAWLPDLVLVGLSLNLALVLLAAIDLLLTPSMRAVDVERQVSSVLSVGASNPVQLLLVNRSNRSLAIDLADEAPEPGASEGQPFRIEVQPWHQATLVYHFEPHQRGPNRFAAVHLRFASALGLWTIVQRRPLETAVRIHPDIRAVYQYELMARKNRLAEIGVMTARQRGLGGEFDRLRDYRRDDEPRHIDWKATARCQKLISREYDVNRNQNIAILLDCGRSMRNEFRGVSHLDRALNAAVMLSYIALGQGDNVALTAFSSRIERYVRPVRSKSSIQAVIQQTYDLQASSDAADYSLVVEHLARYQRKRSLVVLLTHTIDEQHTATIGPQPSSEWLTARNPVCLRAEPGSRGVGRPNTDDGRSGFSLCCCRRVASIAGTSDRHPARCRLTRLGAFCR